MEWAILWGAVWFIVAIAAVAVVAYTFRDLLKEWLQIHAAVRSIAAAVAGLLSLIGGLAVEWTGLSDIRHDKGELPDLFWFCVAIILAGVGFATTVAVAWLTDYLNADIRKLAEDNSKLAGSLKDEQANLVRERSYTSLAIKVCSIFLDVVNVKRNNIIDLVKSTSSKKRSIELADLRTHLNPRAQISRIIQTLLTILSEKVAADPSAWLRIALFCAKKGQFSLIHCIDNLGYENCVTEPSERNRHWFRVRDGKSLAAKAARAGTTMVVANTGVGKTEFQHFGEPADEKIKSIVCMPIGPRNKQCDYVLSIDCNLPDFFSDTESEIKWLDFMRVNAETRLIFEFAMDKLLPTAKVDTSPTLQGPHHASASRSDAASKNKKRS
jgi:hypothetical protein